MLLAVSWHEVERLGVWKMLFWPMRRCFRCGESVPFVPDPPTAPDGWHVRCVETPARKKTNFKEEARTEKSLILDCRRHSCLNVTLPA